MCVALAHLFTLARWLRLRADPGQASSSVATGSFGGEDPRYLYAFELTTTVAITAVARIRAASFVAR